MTTAERDQFEDGTGPEKQAGGSPAGDRPANALTVRAFRLLWLNNIGFFLVSNAQRFVFGWLVLDGLQRAEREQGLVVFTLGLPAVFLVLHAGAWADRWDRRRMLIATQAAGGLVMAATAALVGSGRITLTWVIIATLLAGAASAIGQPVRSSLIPALVAKEQLFSAIAINAIAMTLSLILGPVLAKVVGDRFGFDGAFWFQAMLMVIGIAFLVRLEVPDREPTEETEPAEESESRPSVEAGADAGPMTKAVKAERSIINETMDAVRHVLGDPSLRSLFGLLLVASFTVNPAVMVTLQAHIKEALGRDSGDAAIPFALMGLGIAITSFVVMRKGDMKHKGAAFQRAMMVGSTMTFLMGRTTSFEQILVLTFGMGLAGGFYINMNQGLIQGNTPQHLMGRVMGLYILAQAGLMPLGALILGVVASQVGTGTAISGAAAISFVVVVTTYVRNAELRNLE